MTDREIEVAREEMCLGQVAIVPALVLAGRAAREGEALMGEVDWKRAALHFEFASACLHYAESKAAAK